MEMEAGRPRLDDSLAYGRWSLRVLEPEERVYSVVP
jgi:hypothetical protein